MAAFSGSCLPRAGLGEREGQADREGNELGKPKRATDPCLRAGRGPESLLLLEGQASSAWGPRVTGTLGVIIRLAVAGALHPLLDQDPGRPAGESPGSGEVNSRLPAQPRWRPCSALAGLTPGDRGEPDTQAEAAGGQSPEMGA